MFRFFSSCFLVSLALSCIALPSQARADVDPSLIDGLEYRLIGPWRGGRVTAVTGVADNPLLYYMGAAGGGVWKTENGGATWDNISDGQIPVGTIGAITVAPSDPNVIYVGTGEAPIRGVTTSQGEGLWKSTDAGRTFSFMGLPKAGQIAKIQVHPNDPDTAWVAVQGQIWAPNPERGVYRTRDGGESWEQVLKVNADTGATDLSLDPTNPRIIYAALWHHGRKPWYIKSGGAGGGIYKSTDSGDTWAKLEGGLPGLVGKIGLDVSDSQPSRIYAVIESEPGQGGLWRSDDYGETWNHINPHRVLHTRAWYYTHLTADPQDPDTVYVLNVPLMKSIDGGKTFAKMEDLPHGDHQDHWINPNDSRIMINGNDGGATITFDAGRTWSSIHNQPTAQFYRLVTDRQTPWRLYGGQQDNSTVSIAAWAWDGAIGRDDYHAVGGGESAHIAFDPDDPALIYATTINGTLTEYNEETQKRRSIVPYPERVFGADPKNLKYRSNWNPPVITSPHDHSVIYYGTQYLLKSTDRGMTWEEASPDLTRNNPENLGRNGGPLTPENVGAEFYHTIFYLVESEQSEGTIWVGADDGLLHLSRDGGGEWQDITPPHNGEAMINAIELSPHAEGTAYVAVTAYKLNDFAPYIYRTRNHGKRWTRIDAGLPDGAFVRVVREDPEIPGLLYAGTEKGLFVSWNDGDDWQSADLNLPAVPITDLRVRGDALAVATQGRAFWVLDDLFVLRHAAQADAADLHVYAPPAQPMGRPKSKSHDFEGENPSPDLPIYYYLNEDLVDGASLLIEILDSDDNVLRQYSSEESEHDRCRVAGMDPRRPFTLEYPSTEAGLQHWQWNLRTTDIRCVDGHSLFEGYGGPSVAPGFYTLRVTAGDATASTPVEVRPDPRSAASDEDIDAWVSMQERIAVTLQEVLAALEGARQARGQVHALQAAYDDEALQEVAEATVTAIDAWESQITELRIETFEDEDAWVMQLDGQLRHLLDVVLSGGAPVTGGAKERYSDLKTQWAERKSDLEQITEGQLEEVNRWARQQSIPYVRSPMP